MEEESECEEVEEVAACLWLLLLLVGQPANPDEDQDHLVDDHVDDHHVDNYYGSLWLLLLVGQPANLDEDHADDYLDHLGHLVDRHHVDVLAPLSTGWSTSQS